ncbi:myosin-10-like [Sycon ciliatum]|uniref:myosin-10-like n=1 Tax=Sycon ciliatum TaxID=27933 RepID=UPI0031F659F0
MEDTDEEREKKLQLGRMRLAKFQQKRNTKKSSKKSKRPKTPEEQVQDPIVEAALPPVSNEGPLGLDNGSLNEGIPVGTSTSHIEHGSGGSAPAFTEHLDIEPAEDEIVPSFASDELYEGGSYEDGQATLNGNVGDEFFSHSSLVNDLRKELQLERDARQRSEDQFRLELSERAALVGQLERQLEQCRSNDVLIQNMKVEHDSAIKELQYVHEEDVNRVRSEEQQRRAEQVQSLTKRLEAQHKEDTDALRAQVHQLQEAVPNDTAHLQQMVVVMREQYEQEAASKATEHQRELNLQAEKHKQELVSTQQQNVAQMEAFRNQVQESVSAQVKQFHEQYQTAMEKMKQQWQEAADHVTALQSEKQALQEKVGLSTSNDSIVEPLQAANDSLTERLATLEQQYNDSRVELDRLLQESSHVADHHQQVLAQNEKERRELLATIAELNTSQDSAPAAVVDQSEFLRAQADMESMQQQLELLQSQCTNHVDALESEKSLVGSLTADLETALSAKGDLESLVQTLQAEFDAFKNQAGDQELALQNELSQRRHEYDALSENHRNLQSHMQDSLAQYAKQVEELASSAAADSAASSAISELRSAYEEQFEQLRADFEAQEESLTQQHRQELADLAAQQEALNQRLLGEFQHEKDCAAQHLDDLASASEDLRKTAEERSALVTRNTWLEQRIKEQSEESHLFVTESRTRYEDTVKRHDAERAAWSEAEHSLREQLASTDKNLVEARDQLAQVSPASEENAAVSQLSAKLATAQAEITQLQQALAEHEARSSSNANLSATVTQLRSEISRLGQQLEEKDGELSDRSDECSRLEGELSQSLADLASMQSRMDALSRDLQAQWTASHQSREDEKVRKQTHEQEVESLNSRLCQLEKALSEQEEAATAKNALVAELENRLSAQQSCQDDLNAANNEVDLLRSRLASLQPLDTGAIEAAANLPSGSQRENLQAVLEQHKLVLEEKLTEKSRLDSLLEEQRGALVQQLLEKAKLESLLQEKNRLEAELIRQRGLLEKELTDLEQPGASESS